MPVFTYGFRVALASEERVPAWTNSLGQVFVPIPGLAARFCVWETRVKDFAAFFEATKHQAAWPVRDLGGAPLSGDWRNPLLAPSPEHPVCAVSWEDAQAFCHWLTTLERASGALKPTERYRLPTDLEWSAAAGLTGEVGVTPTLRNGGAPGLFPWGTQWPPPSAAGNLAGEESSLPGRIKDYRDAFERTAPVGSFAANRHGLFDLSGNVSELCEDHRDAVWQNRAVRGGDWSSSVAGALWTSKRFNAGSSQPHVTIGFRIVLVDEPPAAPAPALPMLGHRWTNSLGHAFVPVPGTDTLFCLWETRVADFDAFVRATKHTTTTNLTLRHVDQFKGPASWRNPGFPQGPSHPVTCVSWEDAQAFCRWLTGTERRAGRLGTNQVYRLPLDAEFSRALGLPEEGGDSPNARRNSPVTTNYLWGAAWPPPAHTGNLLGGEFLTVTTIAGYRDGFPRTAPVGCFPPNAFGLYDLIGNVWELCEDWYAPEPDSKWPNRKPHRGAGWDGDVPGSLLATTRFHMQPDRGFNTIGFRVVLAHSP